MARRPQFQAHQLAFTAHIREPAINPRPQDAEDRRMQIYRDLLYNNVAGFIESGFPVLRRIYSEQNWDRMVRDFFARHRCQTPYFTQITREFLSYLEEEREPQPEDPPFLGELAHYEWVELALSVDDAEDDLTTIDPNGDLLAGVPVVSSLAWLMAYQYPVHRIGPDYQPTEPSEQPHYLLVYRDRRDEVQFMELNPVTARLLDLIQQGQGETGLRLLEIIAGELGHSNAEAVIKGGTETLSALHGLGVILGARRGGAG